MENYNGKVTKIETQKKNKNRVNVYLDDEYTFSCSTEIIYTARINIGDRLDLLKLKKVIEEDDFIKCKNDSLNIIEKTYKTENEIRNKLILKGYGEDVINKAMVFLKEYNFLDDAKFCDLYIKEKLRNQSKNKIKYDLIKRGIGERLVKEKLEAVRDIQENVEESSIFELARKKYEIVKKNEADKRKQYKKMCEFLLRKGYSWEDVKKVLNHLMEYEAEE